MKQSIIVSHPTGNSFVRAMVGALEFNQILHGFYTTLATFPKRIPANLEKLSPLGELHRRKYDAVIQSRTHQFPWREIGRQVAQKVGLQSLIQHESGYFSVDAVYRSLDRHVANRLAKLNNNSIKAVYAYEDGALSTFRKAKELGICCIYELPIAYWSASRELLQQEAERLPEWAITLGGGTQDSQYKLEQKTQELALADVVIMPSHFVRNSLPTWVSGKRLVIAPFGTPGLLAPKRKPESYTPSNRPLRVLFAGSMGQRKGLGDLFAAVRILNNPNLELVVLGSLLAPMNFYRHQLPKFTYEPSRSHEQVLQLMRTCDVFCLPSIVEGRALVMQEAMSQGLPLLITPNTGGEDLVIAGKTGFLVPIRSPEAIAEKLIWFLENRLEIPLMGRQSQEHASTYTWDQYSRTIIEAIDPLLQ